MKFNYPIEKIRSEFPVLARQVRGKRLVYLDSAASTLKPRVVIDRMNLYYSNETANIHRGAHFLAEQGTAAYEAARETVRSFLNAPLASEIVFTRGTTESMNLIASSWGERNLSHGDEIILSELEHHSNIVPWQMIAEKKGAKIRVIPILDSGELDIEAYYRLLSNRTKMVSVTWCSNALGTINPIDKMIKAAHDCGALVTVDAAQAVSSLVADVQALDCDFLAFSGHKLFGPYGVGVLYGKAEILESMPPYQGGGSMIAEVTWEKTTWADLPHKFEAGTPAISAAIGLDSAIRYFQSLGAENVANYEHQLLDYATRELKTVSGLRIIGEAPQKAAILSFVMEGAHPADIGQLIDQQGVAIRAGHHCCQPLMRRLGLPATARASFSVYNTFEEIDILKQSLIKAKEFF